MSFNRPIPFILILSVITALCLSGFHYIARSIQNSAVLLISADSIITMNPMEPRVEAAALQNGKIIATGNLEQLKQQWPEAEHRAFSGKTLTPGFVENHLHPAMAALLLPFHWITPFEWQLPDKQVSSTVGEEAYQAELLQALENSEDEFFTTWGYHHYFHGEMSRALLDQLAPDRPVIVWHRSFHEIWANSKALEIAGITPADVEGRSGTNFDEGHFYESGLEVAFVSASLPAKS